MAWNTVVQFRDMRGMSMPAYFSGAYSAQEWICHGAMQSTGCWINFINEEISEGRIQSDAKVLMLTESRGFHLTCDYTPDVRDDAAPFLLQIHQAGSEPRALAEHLLAEGYTHIVYNPLRIRWISLNRQRAFPRVKVAVSHLKNLTREFGVIEFVTENDKVTVIRLVADEPVDVAPDDKLEADQSQPVPTGDDQPTASP